MTRSQDGYKQVLGPRRLWSLRLLAVCVFSVLFITWALSTGGTSSPWITGGFVALSVAVTSEVMYSVYPRRLEFRGDPGLYAQLFAASVVSLISWAILAFILTTFGSFLPLPTELNVSLMSFWMHSDTNLVIFFVSGTIICLHTDILAFASDDLSNVEGHQADSSGSSGSSPYPTSPTPAESPSSRHSVEDGEFPWLDYPDRGWEVPCPACKRSVTNEFDAFASHWVDSDGCPGPQVVESATWHELGVDPGAILERDAGLQPDTPPQEVTETAIDEAPSAHNDPILLEGGFPFIGNNRERVRTQCPGCSQRIDNTLDSLVAHWRESATCDGPPATIPADVDLDPGTWTQVCRYINDGVPPEAETHDTTAVPSASASEESGPQRLIDRAEARIEEVRQAIQSNQPAAAETAIEEAETAIAELEASDTTTRSVESLREQLSGLRAEQAAQEADSTVQGLLGSIGSARSEAANFTAEGKYDRAASRLESGFESLAKAERLTERHDLDRDDQIESARKRLEKLTTRVDTICDTIDDAEDRIQRAKRGAQSNDIEAAEKALDGLEACLETLEEYDGTSQAVDRLSSELEDARSGLNSAQADSSVRGLLGSVGAARSRAETLIGKNEYDQAIARLESALDSLEKAAELDSRHDLGRAGTIESRREDIERLLSESRPSSVVEETIESAEEAVGNGISRREADDVEAAVEAFEAAQRHYRTALTLCENNDLPELWEVEQRQLMVESYLEISSTELEERRRTVHVELDRHLETAASDLTQAQQHHEVNDPASARESLGSAVRSLGEARQLLAQDVTGEEFTDRYETLVQETETLDKELPDESETSTYRARDLVEALQGLAMKITESPRPEFVNAYGEYPVEAYLEMYGSWPEALAAANLDPVDESARERRTYSRGEVLEALSECTQELGHPPSQAEMNEHGNMSASPVNNRFRDWDTALELAGVTDEGNSGEHRHERAMEGGSESSLDEDYPEATPPGKEQDEISILEQIEAEIEGSGFESD